MSTSRTHRQRPGLRSVSAFAVAVALLPIAMPPLLTAQQTTQAATATGSVVGRVKNAVTGNYLNNARVSVKGTEIFDFTDQFGTYRLVDIPSGRVELEIFYTDLDLATVPVTVPSGGLVEQDVELTSQARYGTDADVVGLDPYMVQADRETDAQALATNEQRFAPNIKNVLASDSLGDVLGSSVGNFLKFVPGITGEFNSGEIVGISLRGIGAGMVSFTANGGVPKVSPFFTGDRRYHMINLSLNDISRLEITKVPTPSMAADTLGGSIDLISKSAFERDKALFRYSVNIAANSDALNLGKEPFLRYDTPKRQIYPVVDFDWTLPLSDTFGIVLTGMMSDRFYPMSQEWTTYNTAGVGTNSSIENPYLRQYRFGDNQRIQTRNTISLRADWKVSRHSVLSFTNQYNYYDNVGEGVALIANVGANGNPTLANGVRFSHDDENTIGATGRGSVTMATNESTWEGRGNTSDLTYRFDDGRWRIRAGLSVSDSKIDYFPLYSDSFTAFNATINRPVRVELLNIDKNGPETVRVFDNTGAEVDLRNIDNYRISAAVGTRATNDAGVKAANLGVRRAIDMFDFPMAVEVGGARRIQTRDVRRERQTWTYNGPDGIFNTFESARPHMAQNYVQPSYNFGGFGEGDIPWIAPNRGWEVHQANPGWFVQTPAQVRMGEEYRINESEYIEETVDALYFQFDFRFLENRLRLLTGVRYERTVDEGEGVLNDPGAVFQRNPDGTFILNAQGQRIRRAEAGAPGSLEELSLTHVERAAKSDRTYDGYYPSAHFTYLLRDNLLLRLAYAKTYGRPDFNDVVPRTVVTQIDPTQLEDPDPNLFRGTLTVRNPALKPWTADNYDLSLEYYTDKGGIISGGVFLKEIEDFFGDDVRIATAADLAELGFDERYVGWTIASKFNSGDARISGVELSLRQSLRGIGGWGQYFSVFANATKLKLEGDQQASFTSFIPESANWGVTFSKGRVTAGVKWNYRGLDKRIGAPVFGPDAFDYIASRVSLDLDFRYELTPKLALAASVNNALDEPLTMMSYGSQTPGYAQTARIDHSGIQLAVGIKGRF